MSEQAITVSLDTNTVATPKGSARLKPRTAELVAILVRAGARGLEYERIATLLWGAARHEIDFDTNVKTHANTARRALEPLGFTVENQRKFGYRLVAQ